MISDIIHNKVIGGIVIIGYAADDLIMTYRNAFI